MGFTGYGLRQKLSSPSASHIFDPSPRGFGVQSAALRACETTDAPYGLPRGFYHSFSRSHAALRAERSTPPLAIFSGNSRITTPREYLVFQAVTSPPNRKRVP